MNLEKLPNKPEPEPEPEVTDFDESDFSRLEFDFDIAYRMMGGISYDEAEAIVRKERKVDAIMDQYPDITEADAKKIIEIVNSKGFSIQEAYNELFPTKNTP